MIDSLEGRTVESTLLVKTFFKCKAVEFDILITTVVVHKIDTVLNPVTVDPPFEGDHCRTVVGNDELTALTTAVVRAGLVDFEPGRSFTLFCPNDSAFRPFLLILDTLLDEQRLFLTSRTSCSTMSGW
jgi:hypothetical protein